MAKAEPQRARLGWYRHPPRVLHVRQRLRRFGQLVRQFGVDAAVMLVPATLVAVTTAFLPRSDRLAEWKLPSLVLVLIVTVWSALVTARGASWAWQHWQVETRPPSVRRSVTRLLVVASKLLVLYPAVLTLLWMLAPDLPRWVDRFPFTLAAIGACATGPIVTAIVLMRRRWPEKWGPRPAIAIAVSLALVVFVWLYLVPVEYGRLLASHTAGKIVMSTIAGSAAFIAGVAALLRWWDSSDPPPLVARTDHRRGVDYAHVSELMGAERDWVELRRAARGLPAPGGGAGPKGIVGLALSGGGIRSATTCLGFLQGLARPPTPTARPPLDHVDYLSTVSGGGWAGGAFTTRMTQPEAAREERTESSATGAERFFDPHDEASWRGLVATLRGRGDYLVPGGLGPRAATLRPLIWLGFGAALNASGLVLFVVTAVLVLANSTRREGFLVDVVDAFRAVAPRAAEALFISRESLLGIDLYAINVVGVAFAVFVTWLLTGLGMLLLGVVLPAERLRERGSWWAARAFIPFAALGLVLLAVHGSVVLTYLALGAVAAGVLITQIKGMSRPKLAALAGAVITGQSAIVKAIPQLDAIAEKATLSWSDGLVKALYTIVESAEWMAHRGHFGRPGIIVVAALAAMSFMVTGFLINRNFTGLQQFWATQIRDGYLVAPRGRPVALDDEPASWPLAALRPKATFGPEEDQAEPTDALDPRPFSRGGAHRGAPLHIVTAALNCPGSPDGTRKKRGTDRLELSPYAIGSPATGWAKTGRYGGSFTLAGAIGISAAAVNSEGGETIPRWARALLSLANCGLGVWIRNPRVAADPGNLRFRRWGHFWGGYMVNELLGINDEEDSLVLASDGGHHDNLGLTTLVERGCDVVVSIDVGHDPAWTCSDLARAAMLLRIDDDWELDLSADALERARPKDAAGKWEARISPEPVLVGRFRHPEKPDVTLVYVKAALCGDMPLEVRKYAEAHPDFPHQTTVDQFFDEAQFEAYHLLGQHLAKCAAEALSRCDAYQRIAEAARTHDQASDVAPNLAATA